jgi:hypothetical protein
MLGLKTTVTTEHVISRKFGVSCLQTPKAVKPHSKNCRSRPAEVSMFGSINIDDLMSRESFESSSSACSHSLYCCVL